MPKLYKKKLKNVKVRFKHFSATVLPRLNVQLLNLSVK